VIWILIKVSFGFVFCVFPLTTSTVLVKEGGIGVFLLF